ncbi:uncharacterized protein N7459_007059 [Penicillium hispanicum]|uniref:uncharacterized protein n=1 Tax=Penicillium hispanicum TaxID=1080232 RepID=UPI00253F7EB9|nr:uncharacterized protein N7459_007059 [Penicillium hispanicum]KAJ5578095.1 hypothetical protein N7459_007059 [Penicillium hispanicum]
MANSNLPTLAFFGATGGCTIHSLVPSLNAGYKCRALVRSPQKLEDMLLQQHGLSESTLKTNLTMVKGNVNDVAAVRQALVGPDNQPVDLIISGIGGQMSFSNPLRPTLSDPTVCASAMSTILEAARELPKSPRLAVISTTGIDKRRDLPVAMMPLYHWMLKEPHADKRNMEAMILKQMELPARDRAISSYLILRPSFLTEGEGDGMHKIKEGTADKPAVGYVIARSDVGRWIFERVVRDYKREPSQEDPVGGRIVTLTT